MKEENQDIEKLFQSGLADFEAPVPAAAWDNIQAGLGKKKKKAAVWWLTGAAAAFTALIGYQFFSNFTDNNGANTYTERQDNDVLKEETVPENSLQLNAKNWELSEDSETVQEPIQKALKNPVPKQQMAQKKEAGAQSIYENPVAQDIPTQPQQENKSLPKFDPGEEEEMAEIPIEAPKLSVEKNKPYPPLERPIPAPLISPNNDPSTWLLAANVGSTVNAAGPVTFAETSLSTQESSGRSRNTTTNDVLESTDYESIDFVPPVVIGLSVSRSVSRHWNIDAGLSYSQQASSTIILNEEGYSNMLRYLGFPVTARYTFGNRRKMGVFLAGSVVPELSLGGFNKMAGSAVKTTFGSTGWQHSLALGAGLDYKVNKLFTLYAQPSYSYYFKQDLNHYNLWGQQRWWPSLRAGLRISLN